MNSIFGSFSSDCGIGSGLSCWLSVVHDRREEVGSLVSSPGLAE